ncbi:hypothetical protein [Mesorhizobium sp. B294B1A1]|uniref:hypothetical protein n=1 Tax=Mesorhizobium sp. B294B1A1 TaxID=2876663 RepID=UPI001CD0ADDA|nr:hypothetical protein [Mesorhizobium sp. B294B1A1]MCA0013454.1 hypothetical protein [Mesorhizobium sp. B294B1A1]
MIGTELEMVMGGGFYPWELGILSLLLSQALRPIHPWADEKWLKSGESRDVMSALPIGPDFNRRASVLPGGMPSS